MKDFGDPARAAILEGTAMSVGAVEVLTTPEPFRVWGGHGELTFESMTFTGIGDRGLVSASAGAMGGAEQNVTLKISGVEPAALDLLDAPSARRAPTAVWRLIFDGSGTQCLSQPVFTRGRLDQLPVEETPGGTATISAVIEGAARGLGRSGGRMRSDADQRLIDPDDDGLKAVSFMAQTAIYWGGKLPQQAAQLGGGFTGGIFGDPRFQAWQNINPFV